MAVLERKSAAALVLSGLWGQYLAVGIFYGSQRDLAFGRNGCHSVFCPFSGSGGSVAVLEKKKKIVS